MRCLTLADRLTTEGWKCIFACSEETIKTSLPLKQKPYELCLPHELGNKVDLLIVDHYNLDARFESECRSWTQKILVIDDLANRKHDCDILLDQTYGRNEADYAEFVPTHCKMLTGVDYALLRPQFTDARADYCQHHNGEIEQIFLFTSTNDYKQATHQILSALNNVTTQLKIDVVLDEKAKTFADIKGLIETSTHKITLHSNVSNMAEIMQNADLAIGAGGTSSWERCCLGLPACVVELADNQIQIMNNLEAAGAIINMGKVEDLSETVITDTVTSLIQEPEKVLAMSKKTAQICDGQGTQRTINEIQKCLN